MPEPKGRKKRRERDRERRRTREGRYLDADVDAEDEADTQPASVRPAQPQQPEPKMPSPTARFTGFIVAVVTAFLAFVMIYGAFGSDELGTIDKSLRIVAGGLLVLLAVFVGFLSLAPETFRDIIQSRRKQ